jgi:hypothetical protein
MLVGEGAGRKAGARSELGEDVVMWQATVPVAPGRVRSLLPGRERLSESRRVALGRGRSRGRRCPDAARQVTP